MKIKEKLEELSKIDKIEEFFIISQVGSFINFMEDAVREVNDSEITKKFRELQDAIDKKRETLSEIEL